MEAIQTNRWGLEVTDKALLTIAALLFTFAAHQLIKVSSQLSLDPSAVELGTITSNGTVKRRHAKTLSWGTFSGESKIYLRDIVYTPKNTFAEFRWGKDHLLIIEPESMVQFDEISLDRIEIQLLEGKIKGDTSRVIGAVVQKKQEPMRIVPYPKSTRIQTVGVSTSAFQSELDALETRLIELTKKQPVLETFTQVRVPQMERLGFDDLSVRLVSPRGEKFNLSKNSWIKMKWEKLPVSNMTYQLEISREKAFQRFVSHKTKGDALSIQFEDPGQYYWRVVANDGKSTKTSNVATFTMLAGDEKKKEVPSGEQ